MFADDFIEDDGELEFEEFVAFAAALGLAAEAEQVRAAQAVLGSHRLVGGRFRGGQESSYV